MLNLLSILPLEGFALSPANWKGIALIIGVAAAILLLLNTMAPKSPLLVNKAYRFFSLFNQKKNKWIKRMTLSTYAGGVIVYIIGFYQPLSGLSPLEKMASAASVFMRSLVSSLEMFVSQSDLIEVNPSLHHAPFYLFFFILVHGMAILLSIGFILSFVSYRHKVSLVLKSWVKKEDGKEVYVFWGMNSPSLRLAEELKHQHHLIFITESDLSTEKDNRLSFSHLLGSGHASSAYLSLVDYLNAIVMTYENGVTEGRLKQLLERGFTLRFIFFTDNETFNLSRASNILSSPVFKDVKRQIYAYCHTRKETINLDLQDDFKAGHLDRSHLLLVDSSILSIEMLASSPEAQPVNFVDFETEEVDGVVRSTGAVTSAFNTLIIGFGQTGQEALSFLYEYGAFVGVDGKRSPFSCIAIDRDMKDLIGGYYAKRPALKNHKDIRLVGTQVGSLLYWKIIDEHIAHLNYVVISLGNDQLNANVAVELYDHLLLKNGGIPKHFVIYTRLSKRRKEEIKGINSVYFNPDYGKGVIRFFGAEEDIFSYKYAIHNAYEEDALEFDKEYGVTYNKYQLYTKTDGTSPQQTENTQKEMPAEKQLTPEEKALEEVVENRNQRRKHLQNLSNAQHTLTKIALLTNRFSYDDVLLDLVKTDRMPELQKFEGNYWYVSPDHFYTRLMENVARCEHLRWVASHEMLGYSYHPDGGKQDHKRRHHICLVSWEDLSRIWQENGKKLEYEYLCYDYNTVETSIRLYLKHRGDK